MYMRGENTDATAIHLWPIAGAYIASERDVPVVVSRLG